MRGYALRIALHENGQASRGDNEKSASLRAECNVECSVGGNDLDILWFLDTATGRRCLVVGNVFSRESMRAVVPDPGGSAIMHSGDPISHLLQNFWGRYVAVVTDDTARSVEVFRDPGGQLPCYWARSGGHIVVASDMSGLCLDTREIDWPVVTQHLAFLSHRTAATCIKGVHEVAPGVAVRFHGSSVVTELRWKPLERLPAFHEPTRDLAERLRALVEACVSAWAARFARPLITLSGGLDSSMIAASLRHEADRITCLNVVSGTGRGDESEFARAVADMHGLTLKIAALDPSEINFAHSAARGKPRPLARAFTQETDRLNAPTADEAGCDALFNGGGGDNVLAYLHSSYPATDALFDAPLSGAYPATIRNLATLTGCDVWAIGGRSLRNALRARGLPEPKPDDLFLKLHGQQSAITRHPWIEAFDMSRPGKRQHLQAILQAIHFTEYLGPASTLPTIYPFLSQPIIEFCLSVATWRWCEGGRDRSLAREAFRDLLPRAVLERRIKGAFNQFVSQVFYRNIPVVRALLGDGALAQQGVIDREAVLLALENPERLPEQAMIRLCHLIDAEAWAAAC